ncbi:MAG: DUF4363 family protein [Ruminococcus sp.]|nr:DUF4363 family protein [Ruminococcus sp.]
MKRLIISVLLMTGCVIGAVSQTSFISGATTRYLDAIEVIDRDMRRDDFQKALDGCSAIDRQWSKSASEIDALLIHDYVDSVGVSIAQMKVHIENGNPDLYFAESQKAKRALASIRDSEYPNAENLL